MATEPIYANRTVSITELRKNPKKFFYDEPVAVLSNNKTAGYMVSAEYFEEMLAVIELKAPLFAARFNPTKARLDDIAQQGKALLENIDQQSLNTFEEC